VWLQRAEDGANRQRAVLQGIMFAERLGPQRSKEEEEVAWGENG
jgi:hypothetical protein